MILRNPSHIGLVFCVLALFSCRKAQTEGTKVRPTPEMNVSQEKGKQVFDDLRLRALKLQPQDLDLKLQGEQTVVYGVVMDWDMPEGVATLVAFSSGDASLYNSRGGGVIGGVEHANVEKAAKNLVKKAQDYVKKAKQTEAASLPERNHVGFYLLTNKGRFYFEENMENFENQSSSFYSFFEEANKVITELTIVAGVS
jgi:hypothetical protein